MGYRVGMHGGEVVDADGWMYGWMWGVVYVWVFVCIYGGRFNEQAESRPGAVEDGLFYKIYSVVAKKGRGWQTITYAKTGSMVCLSSRSIGCVCWALDLIRWYTYIRTYVHACLGRTQHSATASLALPYLVASSRLLSTVCTECEVGR